MPNLGEYTLQELKDVIDAVITGKTLPNSISNTDDGALRKTIVEDLYLKIQAASQSGGTGGGSSASIQFPADPSLDIALHRNRLVMNDGGVAKLANMSGGTTGAKGKFRIDTNNLPVYPMGAEYEFDFKGVNFVDGDQIIIPIMESNGVTNQYAIATARTSAVSTSEFTIGATLSDSLDAVIVVLQTHQIGAWSVQKVGDKIRFKNTGILTGIVGSNSYAMPTQYNSKESMFIRNDIVPFNPNVTYTVDGGFVNASFSDQYGGNWNYNLGLINVDNYYPFMINNGYYVDTNGNLAFYNGSTYENVSSITRNENGDLILVSASNTYNQNTFSVWTPTYQTSQGTNYDIVQTVQGVDGTLLQSWVDNLMYLNQNGNIITVNNGNCYQTTVIHALGLLGDFTAYGVTTIGYNGWSIPQNTLELSKMIKENFVQNPSSLFNVTADGHSLGIPEAWVEIEEKFVQTQGNCNPQLLTFNDYSYGANPFSTFFVSTQITAPLIGQSAILAKPVLGFLQNISNNIAYISDTNVNIGVIEDIVNNEITQGQIDAIEANFDNVLYCYYALGTDGQLKKLSLMGNFWDNETAALIVLGGGLFVGCHAAGRGENLMVRRVIFFGN